MTPDPRHRPTLRAGEAEDADDVVTVLAQRARELDEARRRMTPAPRR